MTDLSLHLRGVLGRNATPAEVSAVEAMWSEHASYASSGRILKSVLPVRGFNHLRSIGDEASAVVLGVNENGKTILLAYSSESHNSPSYVCAHPGAATGIGGNQRDNAALTGNLPVAMLEARRQCHPLFNPNGDPVLQHLMETTKGIGDYSNAMGVPHGDGSIRFHPGFSGNNLVNVMCLSIAEKDRLFHNKVPVDAVDPKDLVGIYVGKASDETGVGGTKFASKAIDMSDVALNEKAVQDPDPHLQFNVVRGLEMLMERSIREGWAHMLSVKDMGAAGLLCSTLEQLIPGVGVEIFGNRVPKHGRRSAIELLEAETQERFFIYVHRDHAQEVLNIFNNDIGLPHINTGARAEIVAKCNDTGRYIFTLEGRKEVDLPVEVLANAPSLTKPYREPRYKRVEEIGKSPFTVEQEIERVLDSLNFKSDAVIFNHYDSHVQGTNVRRRGQGSATLRVHPSLPGIGFSAVFDSNTTLGLLDPKLQAEDSFVRGAYKLATVGCSVVGVTNNANYGRTDNPEEFWQFVKGQEGIARACNNWELEEDYLNEILKDPEVRERFENSGGNRKPTTNGGNCSLNKGNKATGESIPPTTILGLVGWTNRPQRHTGWALDLSERSSLYLIGPRSSNLGGTDYTQEVFGHEYLNGRPFEIDYERSRREVELMIQAVRAGMIQASNVIEEGGLCNAIAEMVANTRGQARVSVNLGMTMGPGRLSLREKLFSEDPGIIVQVMPEDRERFTSLMDFFEVNPYMIGGVTPSCQGGSLSLYGLDWNISQDALKRKYENKIMDMVQRGEEVRISG